MQKLSENIVILLGGSIFLLLITLFIVFLLMAYKKRDTLHLMERKSLEEDFMKQLLQSQIEVQEQTFQQIGKELHDNVAQLLSTSRMLIGITERSLEVPPDTLITANKTLGEAIEEIRSLSRSLDKEWLEQFNFLQNLKTEIQRINASKSIDARFTQMDEPKLPPGKQIILFRIVQEALQNAIKHGHCSQLKIELSNDETHLHIQIKDDGIGFIPEKAAGMGMRNMRHRTHLLGGTISWESTLQSGTLISISIPQTPT